MIVTPAGPYLEADKLSVNCPTAPWVVRSCGEASLLPCSFLPRSLSMVRFMVAGEDNCWATAVATVNTGYR